MTDTPEIVATLEEDTGAFCVDVLRHEDGNFTYVEYARDADDEDAWHARSDAEPQTFKTQFAAYSAAMRDVDWLLG